MRYNNLSLRDIITDFHADFDNFQQDKLLGIIDYAGQVAYILLPWKNIALLKVLEDIDT